MKTTTLIINTLLHRMLVFRVCLKQKLLLLITFFGFKNNAQPFQKLNSVAPIKKMLLASLLITIFIDSVAAVQYFTHKNPQDELFTLNNLSFTYISQVKAPSHERPAQDSSFTMKTTKEATR